MTQVDLRYEVESGGRRYFGNVALMPFHRFTVDGETYLLNVATVQPYRLSARAARALDRAARSYSGSLLSEQDMLELEMMGLVADTSLSTFRRSAPPPVAAESIERIGTVARMSLFVSQQCNFACTYCYGDDGEYGEKGAMSRETAFAAVAWLIGTSDSDDVNIAFFGGEPLMRFDLIRQVVDYAQQTAAQVGKEVSFSITTNGSLLTKNRIEYLREKNIGVNVSFDGPPGIQNRQRPYKSGKPSYGKVVANVRNLLAVHPRVSAHAVVLDGSDLEEIRTGMLEAGFQRISMNRASPRIGCPASLGAPTDPTLRGNRARIAVERTLADELRHAIKTRTLGKQSTKSTVGIFIRQFLSGQKRPYFCQIGKGIAAISARGDVYPCHRFVGQEEVKLGNVAEYVPDKSNEYYRATVDTLPECGSCWARYACGGGCRYQNKAVRGDVTLPDPVFCEGTKKILELAVATYLALDGSEKTYAREHLGLDVN